MEGRGLRGGFTTDASPLHTSQPLRRTAFNRLFAVVYFSAVIPLLYRHVQNLSLYPTTTSFLSFSITLSLFISDLVLAFMWATAQAFRMSPIRRREFPENLRRIIKDGDHVGLDVFICTADPHKEPPMNVVNTALSLMAYDYPADKISVYVSDDGGSALTLFAFMEAAEFASHWLPFCRDNNIMERSPQAYFEANYHSSTPQLDKIKYEQMQGQSKQTHGAFAPPNTDQQTIRDPTISYLHLLESPLFEELPQPRIGHHYRQHCSQLKGELPSSPSGG